MPERTEFAYNCQNIVQLPQINPTLGTDLSRQVVIYAFTMAVG